MDCRMKKKSLITMLMATSLVLISTFNSFAGEWKLDEKGWWYQYDDGTYPAGKGVWIDGNSDGIAERYYFFTTGYMASDAMISGTPDGNVEVNADGQWIYNGVVQTKNVEKGATSEEGLR